MAALQEQLSADLKDAMRAGDATRRDEIRGLLAMFKAEQQAKFTRTLTQQKLIGHDELADDEADAETLSPEQLAQIDRLRAESALSAEEEFDVLLQRVKQHRQSIDSFRKGKREDLIQFEEAQLQVDEAYLPQQLDSAAIEEAIRAAIAESGAQGPRETGKVMGLLTARLRGRADMKSVATRVQGLLAGR
jgi:uncharacterized protein YqeY